MIISPPYLPRQNDPAADAMEAIKDRELFHGIYPICSDRRWHGGSHIAPLDANEPVRAIADGEVVAYRVCQNLEGPDDGPKDSSAGFVLLKHETETGENRKLRFHSLYMHLRHLGDYVGTGCDPNLLPQWLRMPTDAVSGAGKKVYRKDILGWTGGCHGQQFLHFEIFMTKEHFDAYFNATQLGNENPSTPITTDYWGNSYFVIPAGRPVLAQPPGTNAKHQLNGIEFPLLQSCEATQKKLYVEVRFHRGSKHTRMWRDDGNGQRTLLTAEPIKESAYEYDLYKRATALYPASPSDGYEMLRFGRILSTPVTLPEAARATWIKIAVDTDKSGYIDISDTRIQKLSDADFPSFIGWQKVTEGNGPFASDGLCDIESLKTILKDNNAVHNPHQNINVNQELQYYVQMVPDVRQKLRGLVCEMASEWDIANNEDRYGKLKAAGEFYAGDDAGYGKFMKSLDKFQFWEKTGLPATTSEKLWFFHPLAFIQHFSRCAWLSPSEFEQIYPDSSNRQASMNQLRREYLTPLNLATRKFGISTPTRLAHFLGQGAVESAHLASMQETSMIGQINRDGFYGAAINPASKMKEADLGHWYGAIPSEDDAWFRLTKFDSRGVRITGSYDWKNGNCDYEDAQKFRGRGFKQLTGRSNYADYWAFRGWVNGEFSKNWWDDPAYRTRNRSGMKMQPARIDDPNRVALRDNCMDSGGFYMRFSRPKVFVEIDKDFAYQAISTSEKEYEAEVSRAVTYAINGGYLQVAERLRFTRVAKKVLG